MRRRSRRCSRPRQRGIPPPRAPNRLPRSAWHRTCSQRPIGRERVRVGWLDDIKRRAGQGSATAGPAPPRRKLRPTLPRYIWWWFVVALVVNFVATRYMVPAADEPLLVPYTVFKAQVAAGNVAEIYARGADVEGRFVAPVTYPSGHTAPRPGADRAPPVAPHTSTSFTTTVP